MRGKDCRPAGRREEGIMKYKNSTWNDFYIHGVQYMIAVEKSVRQSGLFTPVIIYNMSAMAIEKLLMGVLILHGDLPYTHTLSGMADFAKNIVGLDEKLVEDMNIMDSMQMICSEDDKSLKEPGAEDIPFFIDVMKRVFLKTESFLKP